MRILAIIPARSGSKSVKDKNIADVGGLPLIALSILPAVKLTEKGIISKVIISTDSQKYADIAVKYGAEAPFLRPDDISGDKAKSVDFILHALKYFEEKGEIFDAVLLLQPTSPFRTEEDLENAVKLFEEKRADSLISCYLEEYINDLVTYELKVDGFLNPKNPLHNKGVRRQDHGGSYVRNGSIYLTLADYLKKTCQIISDFPLLYIMKKIYSVNLDTEDDLKLIRRIYADWHN